MCAQESMSLSFLTITPSLHSLGALLLFGLHHPLVFLPQFGDGRERGCPSLKMPWIHVCVCV